MLTIDQALNIIKQLLDGACAEGMFKNMESAATATNAYNTIFEHCKQSQKPAENDKGQ